LGLRLSGLKLDSDQYLPQDMGWMMAMGDETPASPSVLEIEVPPHGNRAFWGYWDVPTQDVEYPLIAMITVNDRLLMMEFDRR